MDKELFAKIKHHIESVLWKIDSLVTVNTCIAHDYGVAGLEGKDFIEDFCKEFDIVLKEFDWEYYFGPEEPVSLITGRRTTGRRRGGNDERSLALPKMPSRLYAVLF